MRKFSNVNPEFEASKEASLKIRTIIVRALWNASYTYKGSTN